MSKRTELALLARGFDSQCIEEICAAKLNLAKIKLLSDAELLALGLVQKQIAALRAEPRPPIPNKTVIQVLHDSKRTCCICRDLSRPIIIHHIKEWSVSRDHSEQNLVVLCLEHHDLAHTKKGLSLALTPKQITGHKSKWRDAIKTSDAKAIWGLTTVEGARWDYFNHQRLFELARAASIPFQTLSCFGDLRQYGMLTKDGLIASPSIWKVGKPSWRLYGVGEGMFLYFYVKEVLERVLSALPIVDVTNKWSQLEIDALVRPGTWIALQSAFYFKKLVKGERERDQTRRCLRRRNGIEIEFEFDAWEATSSTSQNMHLSGYQTALVILLVRSVEKSKSITRISGSCLAIGGHFAESRIFENSRPPPSHIARWEPIDDDEEL